MSYVIHVLQQISYMQCAEPQVLHDAGTPYHASMQMCRICMWRLYRRSLIRGRRVGTAECACALAFESSGMSAPRAHEKTNMPMCSGKIFVVLIEVIIFINLSSYAGYICAAWLQGDHHATPCSNTRWSFRSIVVRSLALPTQTPSITTQVAPFTNSNFVIFELGLTNSWAR